MTTPPENADPLGLIIRHETMTVSRYNPEGVTRQIRFLKKPIAWCVFLLVREAGDKGIKRKEIYNAIYPADDSAWHNVVNQQKDEANRLLADLEVKIEVVKQCWSLVDCRKKPVKKPVKKTQGNRDLIERLRAIK